MTALSADQLAGRLAELAGDCEGSVYVAFSGGLDSTVLLHLASEVPRFKPVEAWHVDHGLQEDSAQWARRAGETARALNVPYRHFRASVSAGGDGPEAAARAARYGVFESRLKPGDWLLSAHHADDQGETLLLNLMRGSGPLGLAAMAGRRACGQGLLLRPLLDVSRDALEDYAKKNHLDWIEDPSNRDTRFDRNFLRRSIVPALRGRWPAVSRRLATSANLAADASQLLDELAALDLGAAGRANRLSVQALLALSPSRQRNLLRYCVRQQGLSPLPAGRLEEILSRVLDARDDAQPVVRWGEAEARRYRGELFLQPVSAGLTSVGATLRPGESIDLGPGLGRLRLVRAEGGGIDPAIASAGLIIAAREGGERLRPAATASTQSLKSLLQTAGILPWMRERLPLLHHSGQLVAVGDLWTDDAACSETGFAVRWDERPLLQ